MERDFFLNSAYKVGKSHGVDLAGATLGTADGDIATGDGDPGGAEKQKNWRPQ